MGSPSGTGFGNTTLQILILSSCIRGLLVEGAVLFLQSDQYYFSMVDWFQLLPLRSWSKSECFILELSTYPSSTLDWITLQWNLEFIFSGGGCSLYYLIYFNIDSYVLGVTGSTQSTLIYLDQDKSLNNIYSQLLFVSCEWVGRHSQYVF